MLLLFQVAPGGREHCSVGFIRDFSSTNSPLQPGRLSLEISISAAYSKPLDNRNERWSMCPRACRIKGQHQYITLCLSSDASYSRPFLRSRLSSVAHQTGNVAELTRNFAPSFCATPLQSIARSPVLWMENTTLR